MRHFLYGAIIVGIIVMAGCKDTPTDPPVSMGKNLIVNGSFVTTVPDDAPNIGPGLVEPWRVGSHTPQICAVPGCDGNKGYLQMWGCRDLGESVFQELGTPIRKGHQYMVKANIRWFEERPGMHVRNTTVRFVAFDPAVTAGYQYWPANGVGTSQAGMTTIGSITTADTACKGYQTPSWTADADYGAFGLDVENTTFQNSTPLNQSWAHIDDVELVELNPVVL